MTKSMWYPGRNKLSDNGLFAEFGFHYTTQSQHYIMQGGHMSQ